MARLLTSTLATTPHQPTWKGTRPSAANCTKRWFTPFHTLASLDPSQDALALQMQETSREVRRSTRGGGNRARRGCTRATAS